MQVLLVNGSPHAKGCTWTALSEVAAELEKQGIGSQIFQLGTQPVAGCIACGACRKTGRCFRDDKVNEALELVPQFDGFVFGSPVYYASASGQLESFLDRLFFSGSQLFANKPGAAVVSCRRGGGTAAFEQINKYFGMNNMPVVTSIRCTATRPTKCVRMPKAFRPCVSSRATWPGCCAASKPERRPVCRCRPGNPSSARTSSVD